MGGGKGKDEITSHVWENELELKRTERVGELYREER